MNDKQNCSVYLRKTTGIFPRTCKACGLGACQYPEPEPEKHTRPTKGQALNYISEIRKIQDLQHGNEIHTLPEWLIIIRNQLQKVEDEWYSGRKSGALEKIAHIGACACACLEHNGEQQMRENINYTK